MKLIVDARLISQITKYYVLDFSEWESDGRLRTQSCNLIGGFDLFYKTSAQTMDRYDGP